MSKYLVRDLCFMKVNKKNDNYYYLGMCNSDVRRVYIPTLNKNFSYDEVSFGSDLTSDYVCSIPSFNKRQKYELDDFGYLEASGIAIVNESDIKKIEKYRNGPAPTPYVDPRFTRRR